MNAFIYVDDGKTYVRIADLDLNVPVSTHQDLADFVQNHGIETFWLSSSMDFPEEYGWTRTESPRQALGI